MMRALLIAMTFVSVSAAAQNGPCSAGFQDPPIFSLVASNPVRLSFKSTVSSPMEIPFVTIDGNTVTVVQHQSDYGVAPHCDNQSVSLGDLAPGSYIVTWKYKESMGPAVLARFTFAFTIPEPAPCVAGVSIQPASTVAGQPFSILYSATFRGFLQTPDVTFAGNQIVIDQSAVIADPAFPGHVPCARGIVQIGGLQPGYYPVAVRSNSGAPMFDAITVRPPARSRAVRGH